MNPDIQIILIVRIVVSFHICYCFVGRRDFLQILTYLKMSHFVISNFHQQMSVKDELMKLNPTQNLTFINLTSFVDERQIVVLVILNSKYSYYIMAQTLAGLMNYGHQLLQNILSKSFHLGVQHQILVWTNYKMKLCVLKMYLDFLFDQN